MENQFLGNQNFNISNQVVLATCPSNIALIKYWGKYENQIPANPSISYTLNHCKTNTSMEFFEDEQFSVQTYLAGNEEKKFAEKIEKYFKNIEDRKQKNIERVKKMFNDQKSFDILMNKIIEKHNDNWIDRCYKKGVMPYPWEILYAIFDLSKEDGVECDALDGLTENFPSVIYEYMNWQFAITHGQGSVCSVYHNKKLMCSL